MDTRLNPVAKSILRATLDAMQTAEQVCGDMPQGDYEALMAAIATEACQRIVNVRIARGGAPLHTFVQPWGAVMLVQVQHNGT